MLILCAKLPNQSTPGARFPALTPGPSPYFCLLGTSEGRRWLFRGEVTQATLRAESTAVLSLLACPCVMGIGFGHWVLCETLLKLLRSLMEVSYFKPVDYKFHKPSTHQVQPVAVFWATFVLSFGGQDTSPLRGLFLNSMEALHIQFVSEYPILSLFINLGLMAQGCNPMYLGDCGRGTHTASPGERSSGPVWATAEALP